jgi:2-keto-3-deoxy-L-fuconate dehydrogenase
MAAQPVGSVGGRFTGLNALVTGGASGIGLAVVHLLSAEGACVVSLDRENENVNDPYAVNADVSDEAGVAAAVHDAVQVLGGLDLLVNSAGIGAQGRVDEHDDADWQRVFAVNVFGLAHVTKAALPSLRRSRHGSIVNVSSIAATAGLPNRALYSASKGAVLALTRAMAADLLSDGIRVNAVSPGTAATPWVARLLEGADDPPAERAALEARQPHGRLVTPEEVADAVAYLLSPAAGSTTGISLPVDGGMQEVRLWARD